MRSSGLRSTAGSASNVSTAEDGFVKNAVFRILVRFLLGYTATMDADPRFLGKKIREDVIVQR